jgi:hypothetical protein
MTAPEVGREVVQAAAELRHDRPLPIVLATKTFEMLLDNWLAHAFRASVGNVLVIALDDQLKSRSLPPGCRIVRAPFHGGLSDLWLFRLEIFLALAAQGIDFIHSDLDAVWLADPQPECFADPALDVIFSQGTYHPEQAHGAWGFVLCCGLFALRAGPASVRFLAAVQARARTEGDDQAAANLVLLESGLTWSNDADLYEVQFARRRMVCHHRMLRGRVERLDLSVGLLPQHRFSRLPTSRAGAVVKHPSSPREPAAKIPILRHVGCWLSTSAARAQILIFSYHKSGTTLFDRIMHKLAEHLGLSIRVQYGLVYDIDRDTDIVLLPHSLLGFGLARDYRAVRIVRDPRDIWVSGYLYHCRTLEAWCTNTNFDPRPPINYPRVDFSMQHRPERWKRAWLSRLNGKSYQQNLQERDQVAGLAFELDGYTGCTLAAMQAWRPLPGVLDVKLEDIARDFEGSIRLVLRHLGFSVAESETLVELAASEDVNRMEDTALADNTHIHSRTLSKWRALLSETQVRDFEQRYGNLLLSLGYELSA